MSGDRAESDSGTAQSTSGTDRFACPECEHGRLQVSDAVFADCDNCDAAVLRNEVGI